MVFIPRLKWSLSAKRLSLREDDATDSKESGTLSYKQSLWNYLQSSIPEFSAVVSQACFIALSIDCTYPRKSTKLKNNIPLPYRLTLERSKWPGHHSFGPLIFSKV